MGLTPSSVCFLQHQVASPRLRRLPSSGSIEILTSQFFGLHCFEWASHVVLEVKRQKNKTKQNKTKTSCNVGDTSESESRSVLSGSLRPHGLYSSPKFPGQNTGVSSLSLLQGIFPTQGLNPGLPHCRQILYQLSHKGSPRDADSALGREDLLEKVMATHSSIFAWRIPWIEEPGGLQSIGLQRVGHD